ncbi:S8 family peptidase [Numidum massiliense]|uniref:S8 family peptidase n=1 Tax=Numidum massiliense TaxID=1522315 RepID=UPI0006D54D7D|nr:S8 family peptidase [Numidum massiliense]
MRNKRIIAVVVAFVFVVGIFALIRPANRGNEAIQNNRAVQLKVENIQQPGKKLRKVQSFSNRPLKTQLNKHPQIKTIDHNARAQSHYYVNEVAVKFVVHPNEAQMAKIAREIDGKLVKNTGTLCVFASKNTSATDMIRYFNQDDNVAYVEPHYILMKQQPNDELYKPYQWNLPAIQAEGGWQFTRGADFVKIAIIDTGVELDHPDLAHRLTRGYNAVADNDHANDDNGHGTHVAGIIASETNNRRGTAGITWRNRIMPVKAMNADGYGGSFDIARAIIWATDNGADIINMSLGNYQSAAVIKDAIDYAFANDVVVIAASGNDSTDQPSYPAAYPEVLSVSAVDWDGKRADFSNFGKYVDVAAPGVDIPSTYLGKHYAMLSGTSMAAPHVTALAGLIRSLNPQLTNTEVMAIIKSTTRDFGAAGIDVYFGRGIIDIGQALKTTFKQKYPLRGIFLP